MAQSIIVFPDGPDWVVKRSDDGIAIATHHSKQDALAFGRSLAKDERALLVIVDHAGSERIEDPARPGPDAPSAEHGSPSLSHFNPDNAGQQARTLTNAELDLAIHVVCSSFNAQKFPRIETLDDVRLMVDILAHEKLRREMLGVIPPTPC